MDVEDPIEIGWNCESAHVTFLGVVLSVKTVCCAA